MALGTGLDPDRRRWDHVPFRFRRLAWIPGLALGAALVAAALAGAPPAGGKDGGEARDVSFLVAGDMRDFTAGRFDGPAYFRGACQAMKETGPDAFLLVVGDLDPPQGVAAVIRSVFGPAFPWYPALGNHDISGGKEMEFLRRMNAGGTTLPNVVRKGPAGSVETTYSFELGDVHVAVINEYFDGSSDTASSADVSDPLFSWLASDLAATKKPFVFVVGHEPAFPQPDMATGRARHATTSLTKRAGSRDRFWQLLKERKVTAYLCGHTHGASARKIEGVWQLDSGHARGKGDSGAPSTFIRITAGRGECRYEFHRADAQGAHYAVTLAGSLGKD